MKTFGLVNCTADFNAQPAVINGFSELMAEVFGTDNGIGARSAVGSGVAAGQHGRRSRSDFRNQVCIGAVACSRTVTRGWLFIAAMRNWALWLRRA